MTSGNRAGNLILWLLAELHPQETHTYTDRGENEETLGNAGVTGGAVTKACLSDRTVYIICLCKKKKKEKKKNIVKVLKITRIKSSVLNSISQSTQVCYIRVSYT